MRINVSAAVIAAILMAVPAAAREYHVAKSGNDAAPGTAGAPLGTINAAAKLAMPGDTVTVHAGVYREMVDPARGGDGPDSRILYRAAEGEAVEIKGSEPVRGWKREKDGVWSVTIPEEFFGGRNTLREEMVGDWLKPLDRVHHSADVFLDDVSLYEAVSLEKVFNPEPVVSVRDPEGSTLVWFAEAEGSATKLYANFGKSNPNRSTVEVSIRPSCFFPSKEGVDFLTVRGFRFSQAATRWAAPTAEQVGMVSTHWCKGWIIEDNVLRNSRCSGITLGKEAGTGDNLASKEKRLNGTQHYLEVIFRIEEKGWSRETAGGHIVRGNTISDCEQAGICGSFGGAFSEIYGNHIYNIWCKRLFSGAEMGGIKLHGAVDACLHDNRIHDCGFGIWLDWMGQGARISSNLMYRNTSSDLYIEVSHGPYVVDNNFLLSSCSVRNWSEGGAFVHNFIAGTQTSKSDNRYTPYFHPHSTRLKGMSSFRSGDDRFVNNIVLTLEAYDKTDRPVVMEGNHVFKGSVTVEEESGGVWVRTDLQPGRDCSVAGSRTLGRTLVSDARFENPDGSDITFDTDFFGRKRGGKCCAGPVETDSYPVIVR